MGGKGKDMRRDVGMGFMLVISCHSENIYMFLSRLDLKAMGLFDQKLEH